jgi:hypothetical protein
MLREFATILYPRRRTAVTARSRLEEREQIRVDLVLMGRAQAVRRARIDFQCGALDDLGRKQGRGADRHDLVVITVDDHGRHVELLEIFSVVSFGEHLDAKVRGWKAGPDRKSTRLNSSH